MIGFSLLALTLTLLWWVAFGSLAANACGLFVASEQNPPRLESLKILFDWVRATHYLIVPWLCCYIAERYYCGWRAALWACLVIAIHNAMHSMHITAGAPGHGSVTWAYGFNFGTAPSILAILSPLAVFAISRFVDLRVGKQID